MFILKNCLTLLIIATVTHMNIWNLGRSSTQDLCLHVRGDSHFFDLIEALKVTPVTPQLILVYLYEAIIW